jgi:hypothetical protein
MPTLQELAAELTGSIPGLSNLFARKYINQGLEELQRDYLWSWMIGQGVLAIPTAITAGTVATTLYSQNVTFDATAKAAIAAAPSIPAFTQYQFRVPSSGPVYSITAYNSTSGVATLDRIYTEPSNPTALYTTYQAYFDPPTTDGIGPNTDFLRYLSINNDINGYSIFGKRLYMTRAELNRRDPLRGALGLPYYAAAYKPNSIGQMQYELWPHCVSQLGLLCTYQKKHVDLTPSQSLPNQAPITLVRYSAYLYAYRWALTNAGRVPELKGVDWRFALAEAQKTYARELVTAKKNDKEILLNIFRPGSAWTLDFQGPIDSNFMQSHGVPAF